QIGELVEQLIEYWRALMLLSCGGPGVQEVPGLPNQRGGVFRQAGTLSLGTILAGLANGAAPKAEGGGRRPTPGGVERAGVRLCRLEELLSVGQLIQGLSQPGAIAVNGGSSSRTLSGTRPAEVIDPSKKNGLRGDEATANGTANPPTQSPVPLTEATVPEIWGRLIRYLTDKSPILATHLKVASLPAIFGPNSLAIRFHTRYSQEYDACASEANLDRLQDALRKITGQPLTIRVEPVGGPAPPPRRPQSSPAAPAAARRKPVSEPPPFP